MGILKSMIKAIGVILLMYVLFIVAIPGLITIGALGAIFGTGFLYITGMVIVIFILARILKR